MGILSVLGLGQATRPVSPAPEEPRTAPEEPETAPEEPKTEPEEPKTEQRTVPRRDALLVPAITGLRLSPQGAVATLMNISTTGLLAECGVRMRLGSAVPVLFEGRFAPKPVAGRVMRSSVARLDKIGGLRYHVGIAFHQSIPLDGIPAIQLDGIPAAGAGTDPTAVAVDTLAAPEVVRNRW
jgi:hypothetical protein